MGKLIDADALSEHKFQEVEFHGGSLDAAYRQGWNDAIDAVMENEPPVDAVPVRHGQWIHRTPNNGHTPPYDECDKCGWEVRIGLNFCPKCGAKMDGKDGNNEQADRC